MQRIVSTIRTGDGSHTLAWGDEHYHSLHGAVAESTHVFIKAGLDAAGLKHIDLLEVGLGTGPVSYTHLTLPTSDLV